MLSILLCVFGVVNTTTIEITGKEPTQQIVLIRKAADPKILDPNKLIFVPFDANKLTEYSFTRIFKQTAANVGGLGYSVLKSRDGYFSSNQSSGILEHVKDPQEKARVEIEALGDSFVRLKFDTRCLKVDENGNPVVGNCPAPALRDESDGEFNFVIQNIVSPETEKLCERVTKEKIREKKLADQILKESDEIHDKEARVADEGSEGSQEKPKDSVTDLENGAKSEDYVQKDANSRIDAKNAQEDQKSSPKKQELELNTDNNPDISTEKDSTPINEDVQKIEEGPSSRHEKPNQNEKGAAPDKQNVDFTADDGKIFEPRKVSSETRDLNRAETGYSSPAGIGDNQEMNKPDVGDKRDDLNRPTTENGGASNRQIEDRVSDDENDHMPQSVDRGRKARSNSPHKHGRNHRSKKPQNKHNIDTPFDSGKINEPQKYDREIERPRDIDTENRSQRNPHRSNKHKGHKDNRQHENVPFEDQRRRNSKVGESEYSEHSTSDIEHKGKSDKKSRKKSRPTRKSRPYQHHTGDEYEESIDHELGTNSDDTSSRSGFLAEALCTNSKCENQNIDSMYPQEIPFNRPYDYNGVLSQDYQANINDRGIYPDPDIPTYPMLSQNNFSGLKRFKNHSSNLNNDKTKQKQLLRLSNRHQRK